MIYFREISIPIRRIQLEKSRLFRTLHPRFESHQRLHVD